MKRKAESLFKGVRAGMMQYIPGEASNFDLDIICKALFKRKFRGVYPADRIPLLAPYQSCILNLDGSSEPGSHWVAVARLRQKDIFFYDSFARSPKKIIPTLLKRYKGYSIRFDESDREQTTDQENCGANCISFLVVFYTLGEMGANKI